MVKYGEFSVSSMQSTIVLEPAEGFDLDGGFDEAQHIFGIAGVSRAAVVEKDVDAIRKVVAEYTKHFQMRRQAQ